MHEIRIYLDAVDPRLWPLCLALAVGAVVFVWRKAHPRSFERLPRPWQSLPAVVLAAVVSGATGADVVQMVVEAIAGGFSGVLAVGGHHVVKPLPSLKGGGGGDG